MKTYEKPQLMVLSFTASDALCSGCTVKSSNPDLAMIIENTYGYIDGVSVDGILTSDEYALINPFADASEGCSNFVAGYCKNTPAGNTVFNS